MKIFETSTDYDLLFDMLLDDKDLIIPAWKKPINTSIFVPNGVLLIDISVENDVLTFRRHKFVDRPCYMHEKTRLYFIKYCEKYKINWYNPDKPMTKKNKSDMEVEYVEV